MTFNFTRSRPRNPSRHAGRWRTPGRGLLAAALAGAALLPAAARANPRPLPFSYPYQTLARGRLEIEQYADLVPMRVVDERDAGSASVLSLRSELQTELEFGITDRLEFAWYFVLRQGATAQTPFLRFQGVKQRLRLRLAEEGQWPVDVGLYLEAGQFHDEIELEEKLLLSRRFGPVQAVVNLWVEQEYYFQEEQTKFVFHPTAGASYEISPRLMVGAEYWVQGRFDRRDPGEEMEPGGTRHYAGPTLLMQSGEYFLSIGAYTRLDRLASAIEVDDPFGRFWLRTLIGIGL